MNFCEAERLVREELEKPEVKKLYEEDGIDYEIVKSSVRAYYYKEANFTAEDNRAAFELYCFEQLIKRLQTN